MYMQYLWFIEASNYPPFPPTVVTPATNIFPPNLYVDLSGVATLKLVCVVL